MKKKISVTDIIDQCSSLSKNFKEQFDKTNDFRAGENSIKAANAAINASKAQLLYKKATGKPDEIEFFK